MTPYLEILREGSFKITPLRRAILEAFQKRHSAMTVEKLCRIVRRKIPNAGLQSVYRNLADFTKVGIAEEVLLERRKAAYALCHGVSHHHHHVVCKRCGRSEEINPCELNSLSRAMNQSFRRLKRRIGFRVERHFLQLEGLCGACQT